MRNRSPTCQCNCLCPDCGHCQPRPGGENPRTHGGAQEARSAERPPVAGQDLGQRPRLRSLVALGLSSLAGKTAAASSTSSFPILATTPLLLELGLNAPVVWLLSLPKGPRLIAQVQVRKTCPVSSPHPPLSHSPSSATAESPESWAAGVSASTGSPGRSGAAARRLRLSPSLPFFSCRLLYLPLLLLPLKFPAPGIQLCQA